MSSETDHATRPVMTAEELKAHRVDTHGRDYARSDDGWDDMEVASGEGWRAISWWGLDGWDLGDWPYVVISVRDVAGDRWEMRQTVEGDTDVYSFSTTKDRNAAIDYLFVWYGLGKEYDQWVAEGLTHDQRASLDAGTLRVPERFRGPFSWARLDASKG